MEHKRFNMVEQQIRPWEVLDSNLLDLLKIIKREQFVPPEHIPLALMDIKIPLGYDAQMWEPKLEARAVQALKLHPKDHVLEIGTGSGYVTALLANLAAQVTSVEIVPELSALAERKLAQHHITNVHLVVGDGAKGWQNNQYEAIILTDSVPLPPLELLKQLKLGGRLFAIIGDAPAMRACVFTRTEADFERQVLFETNVTPLKNATQPERFVF